MKAFLKTQKTKILRHLFSRNSLSCSMFNELDDLIKLKDSFIKYINFEYSVAIIYNTLMSLSTLLYVLQNYSQIYFLDKISTLWLILVSFIKIFEIFPKLVLIFHSNKIAKHSRENDLACMRRLMNLVRSNIFFYNAILGYSLLLSYSSFFILIKRPVNCNEKALNQLNYNINILMYGFLMRMVITFINYHFHFNYGVNHADLANIDPFEDLKKVEKVVFEKISEIVLEKEKTEIFLKENLDCCICMNSFEEGQKLKILPCSEKHIFHLNCIAKWFDKNSACPTCRKEVNKSCFAKNESEK